MTDDQQARIKLDWVQMTAGALTAVTSAVLLSTVGVAGTLIGVAVGSVVGTVGNAVYSHYLALSRRRVAGAKVLAERRTRAGSSEGRERPHGSTAVEARGPMARVSWREVLSGLPWRRVVVGSGAVFVLALGSILTFEAIGGRALATYTGGTDRPVRTSIPGLGGGESRQQPEDAPDSPQPDGPESEGEDPPVTSPTPTPTPDVPAPTETAPLPESPPPPPAELPPTPTEP